MIRILIADDHTVVRNGLRHILERAGGFEIVGEAADGAAVPQLAREHPAQVILLDLSMPGRNGLDLIGQLRTEHPTLRVVVLTMHAEEQYVMRAFRAGAAGYLTKESAATEVVNALTKVAAGGIYISPAMAEKLATGLQGQAGQNPLDNLSDRELEVYRRIVAGEALGEIANALCVSAKTVSTYKMRLMEKLQLRSDAALVRYAIRHALFEDNSGI